MNRYALLAVLFYMISPTCIHAATVMIAHISFQGSPDTVVTPPAGWSPLRTDTAGSGNSASNSVVFYRIVSSADNGVNDYEFEFSSTRRYGAAIMLFTGVDPDQPVAASAATLATTSGTVIGTPSVQVPAGGYLLRIYSHAHGGSAINAPTGPALLYSAFTSAGPNGASGLAAGDPVATGSASGTLSTSHPNTAFNIGQTIALAGETGGAVGFINASTADSGGGPAASAVVLQPPGIVFSGVDRYHITIQGDNNGITCLSEAVTITAIDAQGDPVDPGNVTVDLTVSPIAPGPPPAKGDWVRVSAGSGSLDNLAAGDGVGTYQFPGNGESSATLIFNYTILQPGNDSETINFDIDDTINGVTDTRDSNGLTDPDLVMSLAGFQFYNEDTNTEVIPVQIAGKPSSVAPLDDVLTLRAVRASDTDPAQCTAAFPDGATVTVPLAAECRLPGTCSVGRAMTISNDGNPTLVVTNDDNAGNGTTAYTDVPLVFADVGGVSRAELVLSYPDVGEVQLHARYEIPLDEGGSPPTGAGSGGYMEGSSQSFIVRPFAVGVSSIADSGGNPNPAVDIPGGSLFVSAGTDFRATAGALLWGAGDDDGSACDLTNEPGCAAFDGVPDTNAELWDNNGGGTNAVAPNFQGSAAEDVTLTAVAPFAPTAGVGGVLGVLEDSVTLVAPVFSAGTFTGGVSTPLTTIRYMEVGSITLKAEITDYLGTGIGVSGRSSNLPSLNPNNGVVGRFGADQFTFTANTPALGAACGTFTYVDQPFDYATAPLVTARATAADGTTVLSNYEDFTGAGGDNWWLLDFAPAATAANEGVFVDYTDLALPTDISLDSALTSYSPDSGANGSAGQQLFTLSGPLAYMKDAPAALQAPFDGSVRLDVSVRDSDGATGSYTVNPIQFDDPEQRWGRLFINNATGSELLDLDMTLQTEYWDGESFVLNAEDSCTVLGDLATGVSLANPDTAGGVPQPGTTSMTITDGTTQVTTVAPVGFVNGKATLVFSAPDDGDAVADTGYVDIEVLLGVGGMDDPWLQYDWDDLDGLGDGPYDADPTGRASFGIFKGPDDMIYIREPWN